MLPFSKGECEMKKIIYFFLLIFSASVLVSCNKTDSFEDQIKNMTSLEVVDIMGHGTNLGNTLESYGKDSLGVDAEIELYETHWGAPITTKEMIEGMKEAGFDTLRIPVAWTNTMDYENDDYTISKDYLDRVGEIATWAIEAEMFVIINEHWSGGWWGMFGSPDLEIRTKGNKIFNEIWTQVGNYFKDYSYRLILEAGNEELGNRLNDEIDGVVGVLNQEELYAETNRLNQEFVNIIRSQGSKNKERFLLIPGYNTDIKLTLDNRFEMPEDEDNKLLLSVHYYDPSPYTIGGSMVWETKEEYEAQNELLKSLTKFTDLGYGIVIGEYGVLPNEDGTLKNNREEYFKNFFNNMDLYGYVPVLWDRGDFFDRRELKVTEEFLEELFINRSYEAQLNIPREEIIEQAELAIVNALENALDDLFADVPQAWLMFVGNNWGITYSLGDKYTPGSAPSGLVAKDVEVKGEGSYTVGLDFTDTYVDSINQIDFLALAIYNGERFYPNSLVEITSFKINGEEYSLGSAVYYTSSDDDNTTRINIYNPWVQNSNIERDEIRVINEKLKPYATAQVINPEDEGLKDILTIEITFKLILPS